MKKLSMFLSPMFSTMSAFILMTCVVSAQLPGTLTNGLVSYYTFDGNANDVAGTNNATAVDVTLTNGITGAVNSAYFFNGTSSYLTAPFTPPINNAFTWSLWVKPTSVTNEQFLLSSIAALGFNPVSPALFISHTSSGNPFTSLASFFSWNPSPGSPEEFSSTTSLMESEWSMIVVTSETNNQRSLYINGSLNAMYASTGYGEEHNVLLFGADRFGTYNLHGAMDDVAIYDRPLSSTEVADLYNAQSVPEPSTYALLLLSGAASLWALKRRKS